MKPLRGMRHVPVLLCAMVLPARAASVALVVGIGAARHEADVETWRNDICRSARVDAETAFRELVPGARAESHLYSHPPRWDGEGPGGFGRAVLLTDGVTDNQAIPIAPRILNECAALADAQSAGDDSFLFVSGIGQANGMRTWVYDRLGARLPLASLLETASPHPGPGRRVVIVRVYAPEGDPVAHTIFIADPRTAERFRAWLAEAEEKVSRADAPPDASMLLPGLGELMATVTPVRLQRLRDRIGSGTTADGPWVMIDFGVGLERTRQEIRVSVDVEERPVYKKVRRPGPLFTIVEVETDIQIGVETSVDTAVLELALRGRDLAAPVISRALEVIRARASRSFEENLMIGPVQYTVRYDRGDGEVRIAYRD